MVLVTTALKEVFPSDKKEKILFLGEWCKLYSQKEFNDKYNHETLLYHWDDRNKLFKDTKYIDKLYEKYLILLRDNLNKIHKVNFSTSYWRIILGPWLRFFIEMIYDRYLSILDASKIKNIECTITVNIDNKNVIPRGMSDFHKLYINDIWNQFIYQDILEHFNIKRKKTDLDICQYVINSKNDKISIIDKLRNSLSFLNKLNTIHFLKSYFGIKNSMLLQLKLNQFPTLGIPKELELDLNYDLNYRSKIKLSKSKDHFVNILNDILIKQIPTYYLENYSQFRLESINLYPKKTKLIFTSNLYSTNDSFKFWAAEKKEHGAKYIICQHGGHFGTGLFASYEEHQIKSADKFFSFGWNLKNSDKVMQLPAIRLKKNIGYNPDGDILIPTLRVPRYSYHLYSIPIAGQLLYYIDSQIGYLSLVSEKIRKKIKFRTFVNDYGWNIQSRLLDYGYKSIIDIDKNLNKSIYKRLSECRLCIVTYNATIFLETFSANYPTLLYWDPKYFELRDDAKEHFERLENVGILHYTPKSLANKIEEIYCDPQSWWNQKEIQKAKDNFCNRFANIENNFIDNYVREIGSLIND